MTRGSSGPETILERDDGTVRPLRPAGGGRPSKITMEKVVAPGQAEQFLDLYLEAFAPLRVQAVARQVLHRNEFLEQMSDPRVWKFVALNAAGRPTGLSTLTKDLVTVPWISPEYFAARYPEQTARGAVYYWGFSVIRPGQRGKQLFFDMLAAIGSVVGADHGVCGYDICAYNNAHLQLGNQIERLSLQLTDVTFEVLDTQTYYGAVLR